MPKVSVIMGVYNCKNREQIFASVNSIIQQSYQDWEFIICNDGSSNNTEQLLQEVQQLDDRIRIIGYKENQGLSYALNECIKVASGIYIARQDDDDLSLSSRLEKQVEFLDSHPDIALVGTTALMFDATGDLGTYNVPENPTRFDFKWNSPFIHPTVMMKKEALVTVDGYRVSKDTKRGQDYDLFMRMYGYGYVGYNIQNNLYRYRLVNGGYKKRPMKVRISEARIRANGFKKMGIFWGSLPYVIKPIVLGLIPLKVLNKIRK